MSRSEIWGIQYSKKDDLWKANKTVASNGNSIRINKINMARLMKIIKCQMAHIIT